jgi:hypothetical protein
MIQGKATSVSCVPVHMYPMPGCCCGWALVTPAVSARHGAVSQEAVLALPGSYSCFRCMFVCSAAERGASAAVVVAAAVRPSRFTAVSGDGSARFAPRPSFRPVAVAHNDMCRMLWCCDSSDSLFHQWDAGAHLCYCACCTCIANRNVGAYTARVPGALDGCAGRWHVAAPVDVCKTSSALVTVSALRTCC